MFTIKGREDGFLPSPSGGHCLWNIKEMLCGDAAQLAERFPSRPRALGLIGYTAYTGRGGPCLRFQLIFSYAASLKLA